MATSDVPIFSMLRNRMRWHQDRQKLLAENVANSETRATVPATSSLPIRFSMLRGGVRAAPSAGASTVSGLSGPIPAHIGATGSTVQNRFEVRRNTGLVATPDGNRVNLEDEMLKVAQNQMDYQAVAASTSARWA